MKSVALLLPVLALGQDLPRSSAEYGAFALPNKSGTLLIAVGGLPGADRVRNAICTGSVRVVVRFERRQPEGPNANGREIASQFNALAGDVFRVVPPAKVAPDGMCLLTGGEWVPLPLKSSRPRARCQSAVEARLAAAKGRRVSRCFVLARADGRGEIALAEFERKGKDALASLALAIDGRLSFVDYPAEYHGEGLDLWRVDDGGVFDAEYFEVPFIAQRGEDYALAVSWAGSEGRDLYLIVSRGGGEFQQVLQDYWYHMPE